MKPGVPEPRKRELVRAHLREAGLLPTRGSAVDADVVELAVDVLEDALRRTRSLREPSEDEAQVEIEALKSERLSLKAEMARCAERARVAEMAAREHLESLRSSEAEKRRAEEELAAERTRNQALQNQIGALVIHENHLLRIIEDERKTIAALDVRYEALSKRLEELEQKEALRVAAEARAEERRRGQMRRTRQAIACAAWLAASTSLAWEQRTAASLPWILADGALGVLGASLGVWFRYGVRAAAHVLGWGIAITELSLTVLQSLGKR